MSSEPSSPDVTDEHAIQKEVEQQRFEMLHRFEDWLEMPLLILGFVWLVLLIVEFIWGEHPALSFVSTTIWIIFIIDFVVKFALAPRKFQFLRSSVLTIIALAIPALRVFRIFRVVRLLRAARAARSIRLVRVVTSLNRGMRSLGATMSRRGFMYVMILTGLVTFAGAAGMYAFERDVPGDAGLKNYGSALWWTAMLMTTSGSEYWPKTPEGRLLCFLLAVYAFAVFGYITATIATFFIDRDADSEESEVASASSIDQLQEQVQAMHAEVIRMREALVRNPQ